MQGQPSQIPGEPTVAKDDTAVPTFLILDDDHPMWAQHTGLEGHRDKPEWTASDSERAQVFYDHVKKKAKIFLDLLIDHPGRVLSVDELRELSGDAFENSRSVAGSARHLHRSYQESGRRYPFYWWKGKPTRYAMKPGVAALFHQARNS
jgi:hypothetical protein